VKDNWKKAAASGMLYKSLSCCLLRNLTRKFKNFTFIKEAAGNRQTTARNIFKKCTILVPILDLPANRNIKS